MADAVPLTFGDRVRRAREARGWSQVELAKRAQVDASWINRIESGVRHNITLPAAQRIAQVLHVSLDVLVDRDDDASEREPAGVEQMRVRPTPAVTMIPRGGMAYG